MMSDSASRPALPASPRAMATCWTVISSTTPTPIGIGNISATGRPYRPDPDEEPAGPGVAGARNARRGGRIGVVTMSDIWAIIPVKEFHGAKHRLSGLLSPLQRRLLADTMLTNMLDAVAGSRFWPV